MGAAHAGRGLPGKHFMGREERRPASPIGRTPDLAACPRVAGDPNVTLRSLARELDERGITVCHGTVGRFLHHEDQSFKKNRFSG